MATDSSIPAWRIPWTEVTVHGVKTNWKRLSDFHFHFQAASWWLSGREAGCQCRRCRFNPWVRKIPRRRKQQPTPMFLPGISHGQRNLVGYIVHGVSRVKNDLVAKNNAGCIYKINSQIFNSFLNSCTHFPLPSAPQKLL